MSDISALLTGITQEMQLASRKRKEAEKKLLEELGERADRDWYRFRAAFDQEVLNAHRIYQPPDFQQLIQKVLNKTMILSRYGYIDDHLSSSEQKNIRKHFFDYAMARQSYYELYLP